MSHSKERDYVLGTHDEELERLGVQHRAWRPVVLDCWKNAGIEPGSRVLDVGAGPGSDAGEFVDWLTFKDPASSVVTDVRRIRNHPLVPPRIPIYGFVYDVKNGKLIEVPEATQIGAAKS